MALPMLFAACTQDELVENFVDQNAPKAEGFYATLNPSLGVDSRATWLGGRLGWDETDKISVYWLGASRNEAGAEIANVTASDAAKYQFNSVFKTTDGNAFESESMVFVGHNVAVYPANLTNYTGNGDIVLTVPATQDANTIKSIPYISNLLDIQSRTNQTENIPGYDNGIDAPMKMAANVFNLTFELKNTAGLAAYDFAVESVELHATNAFATKATINASNRRKYDTTGSELTHTEVVTPFYGSEQDYKDGNTWKKANTITKNLWVAADATSKVSKLTTTAITDNGNGTYTAQFVILPTNEDFVIYTAGVQPTISEVLKTAKIVINTTCGHVDITTPGDNAATTANESLIVASAAGAITLEECFEAIVSDDYVAYNENSTSKFMGEKTGRVFPRSIVADMNNATLDNSAVYTSVDIIRYVNIYNKMGKENTADDKRMNLILSSNVSGNTTFAGLTKAALAAVDGENNYSLGISGYKNVTLSAGNVSAVQISDAGAVYNIKALTGDKSVELVLAAGEWTMNDALNLNEKISKVCNKGTLTVNGTTDEDNEQNYLNETICNEGTLKIGGNGILQVKNNLTTAWGSTTEIATGQNLLFTENITEGLYGTFNVNAADAFMTTKEGKQVTNEGVINNWGTVAAEGDQTANGFINKASHTKIGNTEYFGGIINVKGEQAITYVYDNAEGTINMSTRTDEIMVASEIQGQIVYPYTAADGSTFEYTIYDRFNTVKFGSDVTTLTLAQVIENENDPKYDETLLPFNNISFIFTGTTTLKSAATKDFAINNLTVNNGANLRVTTGNKLTVNDLTNDGTITIGGYIYYKNNYKPGRLLSQGGAIKKYEVSYAEVLVNAAIESALENGEAVINVDRNITLSEPMSFTLPEPALFSRSSEAQTIKITLDLNGKTLKNDISDVIYVGKGVELTITGNGKVLGATTDNASSCAVWADGGKVVIENGYYAVGGDGTDRNDCIYAKNGGHITINGGEFEYTGTVTEAMQYGNADGNKFLLNLKDDTEANGAAGDNNVIMVNAGKFWRFNPAASTSEPTSTSFIQVPPATGSYATVVAEGKEEATPSTNTYKYEWGNVFYTVK